MKIGTLFDSFILLVFVFLLIISANYPFELKLLPWIFIILAIILLIVQIIRDNFLEKDKEAKGWTDLNLNEWFKTIKSDSGPYLGAIAWVMGLFVALYLLGFVAAVPLFTVLFLKANGESWFFSIGLSVLVWGAFFFIFVYVLEVGLYEGKFYLMFFD